MGLDFISKARAAIEKRWSLGRDELASPGLFTANPGTPARVLNFSRRAACDLQEGAELVLFVDGDKLLARHETAVVAAAIKPPADVLDRVRDASNCALGSVVGVHKVSGVVDIEVQ